MKVFDLEPGRLRQCEHAIDVLRDYLDAIRFHSFFQYQAGINNYGLTPSIFHCGSADRLVKTMTDATQSEEHTLGLLRVLCATETVAMSALDAREQQVATTLAAAGLLVQRHDSVGSAGLQLISSHGVALLIDARIHFLQDSLHEVYIGLDSYLLLYYLEPWLNTNRGAFLDLCCGSGIIGQVAAARGLSVVSTDIAAPPLFLTRLNTRLNNHQHLVAIREETLAQSLSAPPETFGYVVCNPPFVAFPPGIEAPPYAKGSDPDGLGLLRLLFERAPDLLTTDGLCCFVADMPGDEVQPHFIGEIHEFASRQNLTVDVLLDSRLRAEKQVEYIPGFMRLCNPDYSCEQLRQCFADFVRETLRATHYYLCTMLVRRRRPPQQQYQQQQLRQHPQQQGSRPGSSAVRVLNRYRMDLVHELFRRRF